METKGPLPNQGYKNKRLLLQHKNGEILFTNEKVYTVKERFNGQITRYILRTLKKLVERE